ncbi:MAG: MFS transporter [Candidatus Heimdallarchaeaceae archaeon]
MVKTEAGSTPSRLSILFIVAVSSLITAFNSSALNVAIPDISRTLNLSAQQQNMIATLYVLAAAMFLVPFGKLSDIYGKKLFFIFGILLFSISSLIIGLSSDVVTFLMFRFVQGVGTSAIFATSLAILSFTFPSHRRGLVLGINVTGVYLGLSSGPLAGGFLTEKLSWESIFFLTAITAMVLFIISIWVLRDDRTKKIKMSFDYIGTILYPLTLFFLLFGFRLLPKYTGYLLIGSSVISGTIFVFIETKQKEPLLNVQIFTYSRFFSFSNFTALTFYVATTTVGYLLSLYFQYIRGLTPSIVGLILLAQPLCQAITSPFAGRLSDIFKQKAIVSIGVSLVVSSLIAYTILLRYEVEYWIIIIILCISGCGYGLFSSPNSNAIMSSIEKSDYGLASALVGTMRTIGQTLSFGVVTLISAIIIGNMSVNDPAYKFSLQESLLLAFPTLLIFALISLTFSIFRGENKLTF